MHHDSIDNELERLRHHNPNDERTDAAIQEDDRDDPLEERLSDDPEPLSIPTDPIDSIEGSPDSQAAMEQIQATWAPGAPETAFDADLPIDEEDVLTSASVRPEREPETDEDLDALDAHSSLDV